MTWPNQSTKALLIGCMRVVDEAIPRNMESSAIHGKLSRKLTKTRAACLQAGSTSISSRNPEFSWPSTSSVLSRSKELPAGENHQVAATE